MAKNKRENRNRLATIIVFIITFIILSLLITNNYFTIDRLINKNKELNAKLLIAKNENVEKRTNQKKLNDIITEYQNIDDTISMTKKEVFDLAKNLETKITNNETKYKIAYITFDDGPYHSTDQVLNILNKYEIKATFFTIGLDKDDCYDSPGGGSSTANAKLGNDINNVKAWLHENNYGWVDWTAQDGDGGYLPSYDTAWNNFTNSINENIEVILFHDYSYTTISMLPAAIEYLQNRDYIILPLFYDSVKVNK